MFYKDYYEGWANQLEEAAKQRGFTFQVGYAENSIETQDAQIKKAVFLSKMFQYIFCLILTCHNFIWCNINIAIFFQLFFRKSEKMNERRWYAMRKRIVGMIIFIAAIIIVLTDGCQKKATNKDGTSIYYSAIESGDCKYKLCHIIF